MIRNAYIPTKHTIFMATRIGSDESLKGDTFGGIVVAAVKADDTERKALEDLGIRDSKKLSDQKIKILAKKVKDVAKVYFVNMYPEEYNTEVDKFGLTAVLNKLHHKCIKSLEFTDEEVIVDQYPGADVPGATLVTKAEDKYIEVAAASVIARALALEQMQELSIIAGQKLPLGSTHVFDTLISMRDAGKDFRKFAKTSFRNVREIMNSGGVQ